MINNFVIAIDGESASGKGTLASRLAKHFHCKYLPTGNIYRLLALDLIEGNIRPESERKEILALIDNLDLSSIYSAKLNREDVAQMASKIAPIAWIREELNQMQYQWIKDHKVAILEGRDIGTVICPSADVKLYLTASNEARAKRRLAQYKQAAEEKAVTYEEILHDLQARDRKDSTRANAPLKKAADAVLIDSSNLTIDEVFKQAVDVINNRLNF